VLAYYEAFLPIVTFHIIDDSMLEHFWTFDEPEQDELNVHTLDQMENLGYDTHNSVILLGSLGIFAMWYWIRVSAYFFMLVPFVVLTRKGLKAVKFMKKRLFFKDFIAITIEGYFEYIIAAYLNIEYPVYKKSGELMGIGVGYYSAFLVLFLFPVIWVLLLFQPIKKFKEKRFNEKYGQMFEHMRPGSKITMLYYIFFSMRRLIFCWLAFYMEDVTFF
jgi:hypothetical protein